MTDDAIPEADRVEGAPHPRDTVRLVGHEAAEAAFLDAHASGRLHHAWLLAGPFGVGKATLAWRIARFLLAAKPDDGAGSLFGDTTATLPASLDIPSDHPVGRRIHAGAEPHLFLVRRAWDEDRKRLKSVITVDEVRKLRSFLQLSATDGGHRVVIVDAADDLNTNAANALLKMLEEPPAGVTFLLVSHRPSRLLPTIRSRCRALKLGTLAPEDLTEAMRLAGVEPADGGALAVLSGGSVGEAIRIANLDGIETYAALVGLIGSSPTLDRPGALKLADSAAQRGAEERLDLLLFLIDLFLARLARRGALGHAGAEAAPGEAELLSRLAPDPASGRRWAELQQSLGARARHARAVNLDPAALILDMLLKIDETARGMPVA